MATPDTDPREKLKRERPGTYRTGDGRFTVEQTSSGWLLLDAEQTDDLGLPLARGPFGTLDEARDAVGTARTGPAPASDLAQRAAAGPKAAARTTSADTAASGKAGRASAATKSAEPAGEPTGRRAPRRAPPPRPIRPPIVIREIRTVDGNALRALWQEAGLEAPGDDDKSLARLARRNPGLVLVAAEGSRVVGSALGAWDGRRGWIYHLATAPTHRRRGIATRLIDQIETALASLGCPKANVMVQPGNDGGAEFWTARGYRISESRQYGRELDRSS